MHKEQFEHLSIVLEIIGFFLVTIDLYGKDRLENLRELIIDITESGADWVGKLIGSGIIITLALQFARKDTFSLRMRFDSYLDYHLHLNINKFLSEHFTTHTTVISIITFILTALLYALIMGLVLCLLYLLLSLIFLISRLFTYKGLMITTGTILFVISKLMAYHAVSVI